MLVDDFLPFETGEALQAHLKNRLCLPFAEREVVDQRDLGLGRGLRRADQFDDLVEVVDRDLQALENVRPLLGLAQLEVRAANDHLAAEVDEVRATIAGAR